MVRVLTYGYLSLFLFLISCSRPEYTTGEAVYQAECAKCHKLNGKGGTKGPDLTTILSMKDENYVRTYTLDPRAIKPDGTMPPSKLTEREMDLLIQYLKGQGQKRASKSKNTLKGTPRLTPISARRGKSS